MALVAVASLAGCSLLPFGGPASSSAPTSEGLLPGATVQGWPEEMTPASYVISDALLELCPEPVWWLGGESILEEIPAEALFDLEGVACAFGPPPSGDVDSVLEVAYRIDEGLRPLLEAYLSTAWADDDPDEAAVDCFVDSTASTPLVTVFYEGDPYLLGPAGDWCFDTHPEWEALIDALVMTAIALDEVGFKEAED
jgi:hypothetical protein